MLRVVPLNDRLRQRLSSHWRSLKIDFNLQTLTAVPVRLPAGRHAGGQPNDKEGYEANQH
jgi:hypothetical protein